MVTDHEDPHHPDNEEINVQWELEPYVDRFTEMPLPLAKREDLVMLVTSKAFGEYDTAVQVAPLSSLKDWNPVAPPEHLAALSASAVATKGEARHLISSNCIRHIWRRSKVPC